MARQPEHDRLYQQPNERSRPPPPVSGMAPPLLNQQGGRGHLSEGDPTKVRTMLYGTTPPPGTKQHTRADSDLFTILVSGKRTTASRAGQVGQIVTYSPFSSSPSTWPTCPKPGLITCPETRLTTGKTSRRSLPAIYRVRTCGPATPRI
jgi:hypothetical protein